MTKAFLYTGATFLLMMTILISANYLLLSKHTASESKNADLEIDVVNNLVNDLRGMLVTDPNNVATDTMSDLAFFVITPTTIPSAGLMDRRMDPKDIKSKNAFSNFTYRFFNYTNETFLKIRQLPFASVKFSFPILNSLTYDQIGGARPIGGGVVYRYFRGTYTYNFSFEINISASYFVRLYQTLNFSKILEIGQYSTDSKAYCIKVTDGYTSNVDFDKEIYCNPAPCRPRPKTICP